jgi:hypothetical protein
MGIFKKKKKITREEVVDAIHQLEVHLDKVEDRIDSIGEERLDLLEKGKQTKDQHKRLYIGKKIKYLDVEAKDKIDQAMLIMYNLQLSRQLKLAIENESFIESVGAVSVNKMLGNPKELAKFLNKALNRRVTHETMLTEADDLFTQIKDTYDPSEQIYGVNEEEDQILSMFETDDIMEIEEDKAIRDEEDKRIRKIEG